jgi:hypothetical protein
MKTETTPVFFAPVWKQIFFFLLARLKKDVHHAPLVSENETDR